MLKRHKLKTASVLTIFAIAAPLFMQPAAAQNNQGVTPERLSRIERAITDLQGVVYSAEGNRFDPNTVTAQPAVPGADASALTVRVSQIERELQTLTGEVERLSYEMRQNRQRLEALTEAISVMGSQNAGNGMGGDSYGYESGQDYGQSGDDYLSENTGTNNAASNNTPVRAGSGPRDLTGSGLPPGVESPFPVVEDDSPIDGPVGDPTEAYEGAFDAMMSGNFQEAEQGFTRFLENHPEDPRAADAQFRLGEIYLATGANSRAASAFLEHIRNFPDDARAPESYLKLGIAYAKLDKTAEACQIFTVMESRFTDMSRALRERLSIERGRAGC